MTTKKLADTSDAAPKAARGTTPDPAGPKIGCRYDPPDEAAVLAMLPFVPTQDGKKATKSAVLRAVLLPVLERVRRILDMPMPPGATLRDRMVRILDKGLAND